MTYTFDHPESIEPYISALETPFYILIAGGIAVGKDHVIKRAFHSTPIMDLDDAMEELGHRDYSDKDQTGAALKVIGDRIQALMDKKQTFIAMGTASDVQFSINRLVWAKMAGYSTVLIHIKAAQGVTQAITQNNRRRAAGQRAVHAHHAKTLLTKSITGSAQTVATVNNTALVDYFCEYTNKGI